MLSVGFEMHAFPLPSATCAGYCVAYICSCSLKLFTKAIFSTDEIGTHAYEIQYLNDSQHDIKYSCAVTDNWTPLAPMDYVQQVLLVL